MNPPGVDPSTVVEVFRRKHRTGLLTLVFTDLVNSVGLRRQLGDQAATTLFQTHRSGVRESLRNLADAEEIETAGDSFLLLFARPSDAVTFALLRQRQVRALARDQRVELAERVGIHVGEVVIEEHATGPKAKDLHGSQIDICARVMGLAEGGQILLTRGVFDSARQALKGEDIEGIAALSWLNHGPYLLKGIEESVEVCEVGETGIGPLKPPAGSDKAQRQVSSDSEPVLGWRPALGQAVPNTQWMLERKLGEGGFGEVWLGRHQTMKERRVFKFCFRADRVRSLKREMTLFRLLKERVGDHPNIVALREVYFDAPPFYVVMDHVDGSDLKSWCESQGGVEKVPIETKLEIVAQIADALQAAHDAGVIHRDVKPGNILVRGEGREARGKGEREFSTSGSQPSPLVAKMTDFGIGQVVSEEVLKGVTKAGFTQTLVADSSSSQTGSQMYMAPELLAGKPASTRSDIYSLGVVLYQWLVGDFKYPLTADWQKAIADELLRDDLNLCVAGHAEDRFATAGELAKHLRSLPERRSALSQQQAVLLKREQIARHWRVVRSAVLAAVVVVLAVAVIRFYLRTAKVRWAREHALPQATQLADAERFSEALKLVIQAERYIPKEDPTLTNLLYRVSVRVSIRTVPPGADVYARDYREATTNWPYLGKSPFTGLRLPRGLYRLQIRKPGFATVERAFEPEYSTNGFSLDTEGAVPSGMVRVAGDEISGVRLYGLTGLENVERIKLGDYLMDKYEVSNQQFQEFVNRGGYTTTNYWKQLFVRDNKPLAWNTAMALFRDRTGQPGPSTWANGKYPEGQGNYPVTGVSWYEAAAYAEFDGKSLPTLFHWNNAASSFRLGSDIIPLSNFSGQGPAPAGAHRGISSGGTCDMAGNAKEWCWNEGSGGKRYILGGSWLEPTYTFNTADAQPPWQRFETYGFRCVKLLGSTPAVAADPILAAFRDYTSEKPVEDEIFQVFRNSFAYDKTDLNAIVESVDATSEHLKIESLRFNAAYGNERVIADLFLPRKFAPPYQTVVWFPGGSAIVQRSSEARSGYFLRQIDFIVHSGRAVMFPVYKGTYERGDGLKSNRPALTAFYRDHVIAWSKDLGRAIDYLQTRKDIDTTKLAYVGMSWGGGLGVILPAVEPRLKVSVLFNCGFWMEKPSPEVDQINFAPRVTIPTLILNGRYDSVFSVESSQLPMLRLLGTPNKDKTNIVYDTGHDIPRREKIRETLAWLDRYLGPVK